MLICRNVDNDTGAPEYDGDTIKLFPCLLKYIICPGHVLLVPFRIYFPGWLMAARVRTFRELNLNS